ncbi:hypothetical protein KIPB_004773 [Kipferlia bialata]|uniref:NADH:flavin oxidoreductase/NADH oxidase N-terminal domain-containing protein n=1 Tax=Kipferlia bialata TaxID=797122 RepID=A0A9K3CVZ9_9EUKA|nr:hypothetical protein KIPB_004773 [Kipferlia bialata]|eukprot:g4773.t1
MHSDTVIEAHKAVLSKVKAECPHVLVFAQLAHAGMMGHAMKMMMQKGADPASVPEGVCCTPLTMDSPKEELDELPAAFAAAAVRAIECGYDGVQIHSGHGYLLASSLSPTMNTRTDEYKAGPELLYRVIRAVKDAVPDRYPVACKMNCTDNTPAGEWMGRKYAAGTTPQMGAASAAKIAPMLCLLELTGGLAGYPTCVDGTARKGVKRQGFYYAEAAKLVREAVGKDLVLAGTGGFRTMEHIDSATVDGPLDMVAPSRPFLRTPTWLCDLEDSGAPSKCISCNGCFAARGTCVVRQKLQAIGKE